MIANQDPFDSNRNELRNPHEPAWQTLAGCAVLLLSLVVLWLLG